MVEININVRRSSICWWSEESITDAEPEIAALWCHCRRRAIYWLLRSLSQTCHAKPKTQRLTGAGRYQLLSRWWDAYCKKLGLKDFSPKSQDAVALQQIKERGALPMIDRGDIRQAIDRCSNIWAHACRALVMVSLSIRLDSPIAAKNSKKRAERSERLMYEQSHRDYLRSGYLHHRLPRAAIITVITPLPTKPSATKTLENRSWRTRQLLTCRCVSVMLLRSMQNTPGWVSWC